MAKTTGEPRTEPLRARAKTPAPNPCYRGATPADISKLLVGHAPARHVRSRSGVRRADAGRRIVANPAKKTP